MNYISPQKNKSVRSVKSVGEKIGPQMRQIEQKKIINPLDL